MQGLKVAQFGLFLILLGFTVSLFSNGLFFIAEGAEMVLDDSDGLAEKLYAWGTLSLPISWCISILGKLFCIGAPEEKARVLIIASVACDLAIFGCFYLMTQSLSALMVGLIGLLISALASYILFLKFLARTGDNVGEPRVSQYAGILYGLIGFTFVLGGSSIFIGSAGILGVNLLGFVTTGLFNYTIFVLYRALPLYIEEVRLGLTDATESAEERAEKERKERRDGPGGGGPTPGKPAEEPQGTPPEGYKLYRIPKGLEPLHIATKEGDRYKVELRLAHGDSPTATVKHGLTALHIAASVGVMEVADCLLGAGVPVDVTCERGLTPIYFAIQTGNTNIVGFFINKGANLFHKNDDGNTPLHWACSAPHPGFIGPVRKKTVQLLISQGADIGATNNEGKTARDLAVDNNLGETIEELDRHTKVAPAPAMSIPSVKTDEGDEEGVVPTHNFEPFRGVHLGTLPSHLSPMHQAIKDGEPLKVETQMARGGTVHDVMAGGMKPIHITGVTGVMSVTELLLKHGVHIDDVADHNLTPMFFAVLLNNYNMVGYLVSRGANINHQDEIGRTPLHWAAGVETERLAGQNRTKLVSFMLDNGADPKIRDNGGLTALDLALGMDYEHILSLLEEPKEAPNEEGESSDDDEYYV